MASEYMKNLRIEDPEKYKRIRKEQKQRYRAKIKENDPLRWREMERLEAIRYRANRKSRGNPVK